MYDIDSSSDNIDRTLPTWLTQEDLIVPVLIRCICSSLPSHLRARAGESRAPGQSAR